MDKVTEVTQEVGSGTGTSPLTEAFTVDAAKVRAHVDEVVRSSVEQTLNGLLDAEADRLCNAGRYEHSQGPSLESRVAVPSIFGPENVFFLLMPPQYEL